MEENGLGWRNILKFSFSFLRLRNGEIARADRWSKAEGALSRKECWGQPWAGGTGGPGGSR